MLHSTTSFLCSALLASLYLFSPATADQTATSPPTQQGWGGCVDLDDPDALVTIGEKTTICLTIADGLDWSESRTYMRVNFQPIADEYSRFHLPNSYQNLVADEGTTEVGQIYEGKNISLHVSSQTALSFQKRYYDSFDKVYPHLTAVIDVNEGVVQGIAWDDATLFCGPKEVEVNVFNYAGQVGTAGEFGQPVEGCHLTDEECAAFDDEGTPVCDIVLYVVWTGTDSQGNSFQSSAYRFSAFPAQELSDRFTQNLPVPQFTEDLFG